MKKFIITEEEKTRILGMHEDHGYNSLNEQNNKGGYTPQFGSPIPAPQLNNKGGYTPQFGKGVNQQQLSQAPQPTKQPQTVTNWQDEVIKLNPKSGKKTTFSKLPAVQVSQPNSEIFYTQNRWFQYPKGVTKGEPIIKGSWKLENGKVVAFKDQPVNVKKPALKPVLKPAGQSTPNTNESSIGVNYQYNFEGDTKYVYGVKDGKWFGKNLANGKEFDLSSIKTTIANLNNQFPNALTQQETPVETTPTGTTPTTPTPTETTPTTPKKLTDMNQIELGIMKKTQTLAYNSAYSKLGGIDRKLVDNKLAGKL